MTPPATPDSQAGARRPHARCGRCLAPAVINIRRHNTAFCQACFLHTVRQQVERTIHRHRMLEPGQRVLVAVSGGKDSLALWELLLRLGYQADGLYLALGIGGYSQRSQAASQAFADAHGARLVVHDLADEHGFTIAQAAARTRVGGGRRAQKAAGRSPCGTCGLSKRYVFNDAARQHGYEVVATGHNLDDEAAVLFGNMLRWDTAAMARQYPVLEATHPGLVKKIKPLYRIAERETAAYCVLAGIDYVVEECPLVAGNTQMRYKDMLNELEERSPSAKHDLLFGFVERGAPALRAARADRAELVECGSCGAVTQRPEDDTMTPVCAFCRARARLLQLPLLTT